MKILILFLALCQANALTISLEFLGGSQPTNTLGAGNLHTIIRAAADYWQLAILDDHHLHIYYAWEDPPGGSADHRLVQELWGRETIGTLRFKRGVLFKWYLDATPWDSEEFGDYYEDAADLGGGAVNTARYFLGGIGNDSIDLLWVAMHEIGHALGLSHGLSSWQNECRLDGLARVTTGPFAGTEIPMYLNALGFTSHIANISRALMITGANADQRRLPSAIDILANAQISGFTNLNCSLYPRLEVHPYDGGITLHWFAPEGDWLLLAIQGQSYPPLPAPPWWIENSLGRFTATVPFTAPMRLYQLRREATPQLHLASPPRERPQLFICGTCQ